MEVSCRLLISARMCRCRLIAGSTSRDSNVVIAYLVAKGRSQLGEKT
jgi:hypothetical protein